MPKHFLKQQLFFLGLFLISVPILLPIIWYVISFLPNRPIMNRYISHGETISTSAPKDLYDLAVLRETLPGIRRFAVAQSYRTIITETSNSKLVHHFDNLVWYIASYIHYTDKEIYYIWLDCAVEMCDFGLDMASIKYLGKSIEDLNIHELAGLVVLVRGPSIFKPGSNRFEEHIDKLLEAYKSSLTKY